MTIEVRKNEPAPVVPPPATYDITGLTYDQAALIRDLLGLLADSGKADSYAVYVALYGAVPGVGEGYQFMSGNGVNAELVQVLSVHPLGQENT